MTEAARNLLSLVNLDDLQAELAERHLHDFIRVAWPILHPATPFVDSWHIGAICEHVEAFVAGEIKNLLIAVQPRSTKSEIISKALTPWTWLKNPSVSFLYTGYNESLTSEHSVDARRIIESRWYRFYWGDKFRLTADQNEKMHFDNSAGGSRSAYGFSGTTGHGADYNIVDDAHDRQDWTVPTQLKKRCEQYDANVWPAVNHPRRSGRLVVGQRISTLDLIGHLEKQGNWQRLYIPAEYEARKSFFVIGKDPRRHIGELMCPERFSKQEAEIEKRKRRIWLAQYQQAPTSDDVKIFLRHNWRFYTESPEQLANKPGAMVVISADCAFKDLAASSLVAVHVWMKLDANMYLLDRIGDHLDFNNTIRRFAATCEAWPQARAKIIEGKANGPAVISYLKGKISGLIEWPPPGVKMDSKESRAVVMQPAHEGGNLWLPDPKKYPWVEEVIEYFADFPEGEYDDDIDAASQAHAYYERFAGFGWRPM